ncbi:MAG: glycosyltransferase, partial [Desulfovibrionaceae bacterium]|nr:glycosyltransferase [Desulfovibrionaceae bacterium]
DTLGPAMDSVLAQQGVDFEVLAVDDGSVDGADLVLANYAARDPRVRLLSPGRVGLVRALNMGLDAARGRYVARMDADDLCLPGRFAAQAKILDHRPEVGLVGCRVRFGGCREACAGYARHVDWINELTRHESISLNRFVECPLAHPSIMFRRDLALDLGAYRQGAFPEDYELVLRWLEQGVRMEKAQAELLVWNDPPGRLSRSHERYSIEAFYRLKAGFLARWLAANNPVHPRVWVLGAGRTSRRRSDLLLGHGVRIEAYVDIDPRKVGRPVHARPVVHRDHLPEPGRVFVVSYVASLGARAEICAHLKSRGYVPGRDFVLAA